MVSMTSAPKMIRPVASPAMAEMSPAQPMGFGLLLVFLFVLFSRVTDRFPFLHLPLILTIICFGMSLISGTFYQAMSHRVGLYVAFLNLWIVMAIPVGLW